MCLVFMKLNQKKFFSLLHHVRWLLSLTLGHFVSELFIYSWVVLVDLLLCSSGAIFRTEEQIVMLTFQSTLLFSFFFFLPTRCPQTFLSVTGLDLLQLITSVPFRPLFFLSVFYRNKFLMLLLLYGYLCLFLTNGTIFLHLIVICFCLYFLVFCFLDIVLQSKCIKAGVQGNRMTCCFQLINKILVKHNFGYALLQLKKGFHLKDKLLSWWKTIKLDFLELITLF